MSLEDAIARIESQIATLEARIATLDGRPIESDLSRREPVSPPAPLTPGPAAGNLVHALTGGPGVVVDPGVARSTPCLLVELDDERVPAGRLVFSEGVAGPLDAGQEALYCQDGYQDYAVPAEERERLIDLQGAVAACTAGGGEPPLDMFYRCLAQELATRGVQL